MHTHTRIHTHTHTYTRTHTHTCTHTRTHTHVHTHMGTVASIVSQHALKQLLSYAPCVLLLRCVDGRSPLLQSGPHLENTHRKELGTCHHRQDVSAKWHILLCGKTSWRGGRGGGGRSGVLLLHQLVGLCVIKMHEQSDWFKSMATPFHKSAQIKSTMSTM